MKRIALKKHKKTSSSKVVRSPMASPKRNTFTKKIKLSSKKALKSMLLSPIFHTTFKIVTGLLISSSFFYASYLAIGHSLANEVVISQSEIVARAGKLIKLPSGEPKEMVRVQDPDDLRKQSEFFKDVKEGDYILMYDDEAVIYDLLDDKIVAVKETNKGE